MARPTALVPKAAVLTDETGNYVFAVSAAGDAVERRAVKVGGTDGDRVEVLGALRAGDRVVVSPSPELTDSAKVVVK